MTLWRDIATSRFGTIHESREDKRMSLEQAVRTFVRPGMRINPCAMQSRPSAAIYELCRQFAGASPGFEYIASSIGNTALALIHLGLLKRVLVAFAGEGYPIPGPNAIVQRALDRGQLEIQNWTMLTITQRLMAGTLGVPFFPTRSLAGSTLGAELAEQGDFMELNDDGRPAGYVRAYRPDISFVHAWAADAAGNTLCCPPYGENVYGALAAREGVIVTVDRIVPTDFIRAHAHFVRIPASVVRAVCHVPYGAHPTGNPSPDLPDCRAYGNDYAFMIDCRVASRDEETFQQWVQEWVLGVANHDEYIQKLGTDRIEHLHHVARHDTWTSELEFFADRMSTPTPSTPVEAMIIQASRALAKRIQDHGYTTILAGIGQAGLGAWLAAHNLRDAGVDIALMAETGVYGHDPRPCDPFVFDFRNIPTATTTTDIFEILGIYTGGAGNRCIGAIGAAQIDRLGNVNSTRTKEGRFIVGSGGANDISTAASETLVVVQQLRRAFVPRVDYITCPGKRIQCVMSTMGRFEKRGSDELVLTGYFQGVGKDCDAVVRKIQEHCGWELRVSDDLEVLDAPRDEELALLRIFDPKGFFLGKPVPHTKATP